MHKIVVLGSGMVGSAMALDMAKKYTVTIADINKKALANVKRRNSRLKTEILDLRDKKRIQKLLRPFDLVICAVPGFMGFEILHTIIEERKNVVDISFSAENVLDLDEMAQERGVTAIVDCGVAPGLGNMTLGYYNEKIRVTDFECLVGGLPKVKRWPSFYKAPFSPIDVIEEYTRPARYIENGKLVVREALSDCEFVEFEEVGTLQSFNSDGLRSLIFTMPHIKNMKEKTLRYPGHVDFIMALKRSGFFDQACLNIKGTDISPRDFTSRILFKDWKLQEDEEEITVMRVEISGENEGGEKEQIIYQLYDEFDHETKTSSMARTTGYTATAAAHLVLDGVFNAKGIFPPELIGKHPQCFNYVLKYLGERGIQYKRIES